MPLISIPPLCRQEWHQSGHTFLVQKVYGLVFVAPKKLKNGLFSSRGQAFRLKKCHFFLITHFLHAKTTLGYPCLLLANPSPISYTIREYLNTPNLCPTNMQVGKWHYFRILGSGGMLLAPQSMVLSSYHPKSSKIDIISLTLKKSLNFPSRNCCDSRKILSQNFLFLELRSPGKFCPGKKIVLEFSEKNSPKN